MSEIEGVFKTTFRNWWFREDYNWAKGTYNQPGDDKAIATIREYLGGNAADVRLSAQNANATTSMVQTFADAATTIRDKLILMEELAEKVVHGHYTDTDKASMQKKLEALAADINRIVDNTSYVDNTKGGKNKLLSAKGETIEKRIDKIRTVKLFPKNLSFDIASVDLTKDAKADLTTIKDALKDAKEYTNYLSNQNKFLQNATTIIESRMASAVGIERGEFETKIAQEIMDNIEAIISEEPDTAAQTQSNITPDEALYLLKEN
ncbi:MAG: flagellin N-terminal helical domain-containing protein [Planctomycetota bacterium]|jgi:flagellin-like hook-associated protein FlgL